MPQQSKNSPRIVAAMQRMEKAVELRRAGATFQQIGDALGCTRARAHQMIVKAMQQAVERIRPFADAQLAMELERLDAALRVATDIMDNPDSGAKEKLWAVDRVLAIGARRARLLGLDAPEKIAPVTPDGSAPFTAPTDEQRAVMIVELLAKARPQLPENTEP